MTSSAPSRCASAIFSDEPTVAITRAPASLAICGATTGNEGQTNLWSLFAKELSLIGSYGGTRADLATVLGLVAAGQLRPVIHRTLPLEDVAAAQRMLEERATFGKIMIDTTK